MWVNASKQPCSTLNSAYNEVTFNEKSAITKENLCTKYTPFTYKYITLNEKLPIMKQNLCIFFFIIGGVECTFFSLSTGMTLSWQDLVGIAFVVFSSWLWVIGVKFLSFGVSLSFG